MAGKETPEKQSDKVRVRAHELWVQEGRPHGRDVEHWLMAEQEVDGGTGAAKNRRRKTKSVVGKKTGGKGRASQSH